MQRLALAVLALALAGCHVSPSFSGRAPEGMRAPEALSAHPLTASTRVIPQAEDEPEEEFHRHNVAVFLGDSFEANENGITAGLDYEFRINRLFGVGGFIDRAWGDFNSTLAGGAVFLHPWKELTLMSGVGSEREAGESKFAGRVGVGYEFPLTEHLALSPWAYLDLLEGRGANHGVVGMALSVGF